MLKILKSKDCKKPKTKKCAKALNKYAKKKYSKKEEIVKKETIDVKAGSNNKIQIGTGNTIGSKKTPTGILNSLGGTYKNTTSLPQFNYDNPFAQNTSLGTPTLGYSNTSSSRWFAPQPAPTMVGTTTRIPRQQNYDSLFARLTALENNNKSKNKSSTTGTGTDPEPEKSNTGSQTEKTHVNKQFTAIEDSDGNITGFKKPSGRPPVDKKGIEMMWNSGDPVGNELWENPEYSGQGKIPKGWVERFNDSGMEWNEDTAQYEQRGGS